MRNISRPLFVIFLALLAAPARSASTGAAPSGDCRTAFSVPEALKDLAARDAAKTPGQHDDDLRWKLLAYYKWRAFSAADAAQCLPMKDLRFLTDVHGAVGGDVLCRDLFHRLAFVRGYVEHSQDIRRLCMENVVNEGDKPDAEQLARYRKACDIIVRPDVPVEERCAQAISYMPFPPEKRPKHVRRCVCDFGSMMGGGECHEDPGNNREGFLGPARYDSEKEFRAAYAAKNVELCGTSELCRGLMGQGKAMAEAQAGKIADLACEGR